MADRPVTVNRDMLDNPGQLIAYLEKGGATKRDLEGLFSELGDYLQIDWHA